MPRSAGGTRVDHDTANQLSAVWACIGVISETLAAMPWNVILRTKSGHREVAGSHPVDWLLHTQPNPEMTAYSFKEVMLSWALSWGNGYAEIEWKRNGQPNWLWPISPDRVRVGRADNGQIFYQISNNGREPTYLPAEDMFHLRGRGFDGLVGYSVINLAARSIGYAFDLEAEGDSLVVNDSTPGGVLTHPGTLGDEAQRRLRESIEKVHGGPKKKGKLMILEENMKFEAIGLPHKDTQFLENRKFQVNEICRWFRVPPHMIGDLERATFSNIEAQGREFVTNCLLPWVTRMESEANTKLFGPMQMGNLTTKINLNALMRGDSQARAQFYQALRNMGAINADDILTWEDMNPIGEAGGGQKHLVQLNQTTLDKIGEMPEPSAQPATPVVPQDKPAEPMNCGPTPSRCDHTASTCGTPSSRCTPATDSTMISAAWFKSVVQNIGSRERHRAEDAAKRFAGDKAGFDAWLVGFNAEHSTYCINVLLSPAKSIAPEAQELSVAMGLVVERYITQRGAELSEQFNNATFGGESRFHSWLAEQAAHAARIAAEWIHSNPSKEAETCNDMN